MEVILDQPANVAMMQSRMQEMAVALADMQQQLRIAAQRNAALTGPFAVHMESLQSGGNIQSLQR